MFHPHGLQPGSVFAGDFRIERALAMGGMGAVYVAEQLSTGRRRALKLLLPSLVDSERSRERFEQEARVASRIASDHVVEVVSAGVDPGTGAPWLAMELLEGETLAQRVERSGPLGPAETLEVMRQLCHALGAAHGAGLVHRDIKPENLFLARPRRDGIPFTLKILDFGIAKLTEDVRGRGGATAAIGSPLWMAPEQASAAGVGPTADVWALGLVVFHCLTGRHYWRCATAPDATLQGLLKEVMLDPLAPASGRAAEQGTAALLPAGFDFWFSRTVVREPAQRFSDANQCLAALGPLLEPRSVGGSSVVPAAFTGTMPTHAASAPPRSASKVPWVLGGVALLATGAVIVAAVALVGLGMYGARETTAPAATSATSLTATPLASPSPSSEASTTPAPTAPPLGGRRSTGSAVGAASDAGSAPASSAPIVMSDVPAHPPRDYKLAWFKEKITQCWKGNEGASRDAGAYSVTITVTLSELGQAKSVLVAPRTHKAFSGCATVRSTEHPWGKGPAETKSFSFGF
ncbi:MAG: serine/threonine protein kinase [Polyangiaceae bacterium]|nr:serine/threonine protein kinase [Polyangiaceae bacterium]